MSLALGRQTPAAGAAVPGAGLSAGVDAAGVEAAGAATEAEAAAGAAAGAGGVSLVRGFHVSPAGRLSFCGAAGAGSLLAHLSPPSVLACIAKMQFRVKA